MCLQEMGICAKHAIPVIAGIGIIGDVADHFGTPGFIVASIAVEAIQSIHLFDAVLHDPLRRNGFNSQRTWSLIASGLESIAGVRMFLKNPPSYLTIASMAITCGLNAGISAVVHKYAKQAKKRGSLKD
jgi:hypothetical protein